MNKDQLTILLVEDDEDDYLIVRDLLRDIDAGRFTLEWAGSYAEGLRAIHENRYDLILLDFRLTDGTGLELLQETHSLSSRAPVIFMTGQHDHEIDVQIMQAGAADYLVKDRLDADLLERAIRYALERRKSAEALRASEDRYRTFVENSTEGIWRFELEQPLPTERSEAEQIAHLDQYAYVAECNEVMARFYGFQHASEVIGLRFAAFLSTNAASDDNYLRRLIHNQYRLVNAEAFGSDRQGQPKYILHNLIGVVENGLLYRIWGSQSDITERKRSENAQSQLAAIVESSSDAIFSTTLDGLIVTWNKAAELLYGYTAQEVTGQLTSLFSSILPLNEMHKGKTRKEMDQVQERVQRGEHVAQFDTVHRHKDGKLINVSLAVSPIIDAAGTVTGSSSIVRDISEQKRAETRLRQSEANMAAAQHIAHLGSWELDLGSRDDRDDTNATPLRWSDETFRILGYTPGSLPVTNELFYRRVPPEEHPAIKQAVETARTEEKSFSIVHRVRHPNGVERIVRTSGQFFEEEGAGRATKLVGTVHDITEQQQAEERIRFNALLLSQVRNAVTATDLAGQITYWNQFAETLYQWKAEEVIGKNLGEVLVPLQSQKAAEEIRCQIQKTGSWEGEFLVQHKDGSTFPAYLASTQFQDAFGAVAGVVEISIDISILKEAEAERGRVQEELRASEQRLRLTLESGRFGTFQLDLITGRYLELSEIGRAQFSLPPDGEVFQSDFFQRVHPDDLAEMQATVARAAVRGADFASDYRVILPERGVRWISVHGSITCNDAGQPVHLLGVTQDITERKLAEVLLLESQQRLALATESAQIGIWDWDVAANAMLWDDQMYALYGVCRQDFSGAYDAWQNGLHPDDRVRAEAEIRAALDGSGGFHTQFRVVQPTGEVRRLEAHAVVQRESSGCAVRMIGVNWDVTENSLIVEALRQSEHDFRRIVETTHEGVLQMDADARITYVNQRYCKMLGYAVEELLGRSPFDLMDDESRALAQQSFEQRRDGVSEQFDRRFLHKDGSVVWGIVSASPLFDEAGRMIGSLSMTTDITERKRLEAQVHQSEKLAALGELVAGVAHEINNPLAAILGNAELLEMHADPEVRQDARTIQRMSQRVTRIVRSLLTFARPQEGDRREEAVNMLVEHTLEMTTHKLRSSGVILALRLQEPTPMALANGNEIQQILLNLIFNAEHALRRNEGEKHLVITTQSELIEGRHWAVISVKDNGHGIPEEILARIFDPFFTTKEINEGTGLGLSICHGIAAAHGGTLTVESALGLGTTFTLALPSFPSQFSASQ